MEGAGLHTALENRGELHGVLGLHTVLCMMYGQCAGAHDHLQLHTLLGYFRLQILSNYMVQVAQIYCVK